MSDRSLAFARLRLQEAQTEIIEIEGELRRGESSERFEADFIMPEPLDPGGLPTLYISGPMTGYALLNRPAFVAAVPMLETVGFTVCSPHEEPELEGLTEKDAWKAYLKADLLLLLNKCQGVAVLEGHENSRGAALECHVARELGMRIHTVAEWIEMSPWLDRKGS